MTPTTVKARRIAPGVWDIESRSARGTFHRVNANTMECPCKYREFHGSCPHIRRVTELERERG